MRQVFAELGSSLQQIGGNCPDGWITMQCERPSPNHIASVDGQWVPTPARVEDYDNALMAHYQEIAVSLNYESWKTCAMRAYKPGPFEAECTAFYNWMEQCNVLGYQLLAQVQANEIPQPTIEEFLQLLPVFERP